MTFSHSMHWRYATKKFNSQSSVSDAAVGELLDCVRLAPSSYGLQPYAVIDVRDATLRQRIQDAAMGQPQIVEGSHLLVFAAQTDLDAAAVTEFIDLAARTRELPRETLAPREAQISAALAKLTPAERIQWAQKQAYLGLGVLIGAAAQARIDLCPMEGFDRAAVDKILGLAERGLTATVFAVLGHRASDDPLARLAKVRKPADGMVVTL